MFIKIEAKKKKKKKFGTHLAMLRVQLQSSCASPRVSPGVLLPRASAWPWWSGAGASPLPMSLGTGASSATGSAPHPWSPSSPQPARCSCLGERRWAQVTAYVCRGAAALQQRGGSRQKHLPRGLGATRGLSHCSSSLPQPLTPRAPHHCPHPSEHLQGSHCWTEAPGPRQSAPGRCAAGPQG